jgi:Glycosyl hydrolases family 43
MNTAVSTLRTQIQNTRPRTDIRGDVIDCHDGCIRYFNGRFYWYGTRYGTSDGFTPSNVYASYSSPDLQQWTPHGPLLRDPPAGVYYRPYVVFNPRTRKYVLWFNWYPKLWEGQFGSAVSDSPEGPFEIVNPHVTLRGDTPGDHNLFVDEDGTGYVVYTNILGDSAQGVWENRHAMSVERLTDDFTASTLVGSETLDRRVEAPAMFKHNGLYYILFGETCCFCITGADARVFVADQPLGPYRKVGDINRDAADRIIIPGQQTDVAAVPTQSGIAYLWMADLWGSRPDGVKGHDLQYWSEPLRFNSDGSIAPLRRTDTFELELLVRA